jgi:hypothetical protein
MSIDYDNLDKKLSHIVDSFKGSWCEVCIKDVSDLIYMREYKIAIELLCENLQEDSVPIPEDVYLSITEVCEIMHVESVYWKNLPSLITDKGSMGYPKN